MSDDPSARAIGELIGLTILGTFRLGQWMVGMTEPQCARRRAAAHERESRRQQREWFEAVARQKARGEAGFASEAQAREALSGKGGRASNLDRRRF
jgi:hypothetical protein